MAPRFMVVLPVLVTVTGCAALEVPTSCDENVRLLGLRAATGPLPMPLRLMTCGDPAALSWIGTEPERVPAAVGVKVTDKVQLPAADTLVPQLSDSAKSPLAVMDEIVSAELPMLRSSTVCAVLVELTACEEYCREYGLRVTDGAELGPIFITKASVPPPCTF